MDNKEPNLDDKLLLINDLDIEKKILQDEEKKKQKNIDINDNINIFLNWIKKFIDNENMGEVFTEIFPKKYRMKLFKNMLDFSGSEVIGEEHVFYWKMLIFYYLKHNKKYQEYIKYVKYSLEKKETNIKIEKFKRIFKCYINSEFICYFKENGNEYYTS